MRWIWGTAALVLGCCSPARHTIEVTTEGAEAPVSAVVSVCEEPEQPLTKDGTRFNGTITSHCEGGSGYVRLQFADGTTAECQMGYVTTIAFVWSFDVRGRACTYELRDPPASTDQAAHQF